MRTLAFFFLVGMLFGLSCKVVAPKAESETVVRFASYNVALYRDSPGGLAADLATGLDTQIQNITAVIQHIRPDVLALMEFDQDDDGTLLEQLQKNYFGVGQHGQKAISYPYAISVPSNTGVLSAHDYNKDGKVALPDDGFGYGKYPGQYAFALLSKFPINEEEIRSFQEFKWSDMPDAVQPVLPDGENYYSQEAWEDFRLSSKNHIDIPISLSKNKDIHIILAHPTPPVFDGDEDRNGKRNYDEIRMLKEYIDNADFLVDDDGEEGGLLPDESFMIMGDLNADPNAGDSYRNAIGQLLEHSSIHPDVVSGAMVPRSTGGRLAIKRVQEGANPDIATSFFGLRIDYVLPSLDLELKQTGVFWPEPGQPLYDQVANKQASDHLLVFADILFED